MDVYQPSDDTFFFQDILENQLEFDRGYEIVLEVGCGSGYLSKTVLSSLKSCVRYSLDLNVNACISTQQNSSLNALEIITCNMFKSIRKGLLFDIIIFNPPYVVSCPSVPSDIDTGKSYSPIDSAWAGGIDGRFWIDRFLSTMTEFISTNSCVYLVLIEANGPTSVIAFCKSLGLDSSVHASLIIVIYLDYSQA